MCSYLAALGLIPGVEVEIKRNSPGGPFVLGIKGGQLVIGRGMAHKILVS
jgi:Fe2+ transport system protein FeoA